MDQVGFHSILILLGVSVILVAAFRYLHLPQVLAYLCAGVVVGPHGLAWIPDLAQTRYLAEFGLVFLMFTIGLEFSLPQLLAMRRTVLGLGGAQVFISTAVFGLLAWIYGVRPEGAIVLGAMLSLSSTAIVMKLLIEQLEQHSRHGRHAFGVLLFQDLVVVPLLILIPALAGAQREPAWTLLGGVVLKSAAVFALIWLAGRWLLRPLLHEVASARSREFFMLTVLLLTLLSAWLTDRAGLSLALGAFLAGMMLGETEYRHQVESDILPFRDILLGLFFVTTGMLLDPQAVRTLWPWVLLCLGVLMVSKTLLILGLGRLFGIETGVALRTGLVLAQGGEFGFALLVEADRYGLMNGNASQVVLAAVVLSMALAPLVVRHNGVLAKRLVPGYMRARESNLDAIREQAERTRPHVLICGYGRSGQNLAFMLEQENFPSLALDLDPVRVREARDAGKAVVYGDATRRDVLEAAGLGHAAALAVTFNDVPSALRILEVTQAVRPEMPVIVRTVDDAHLERLKLAGATEVVPESLEGSLMMGSHMLWLLGVPVIRVLRHVRDIQSDRYRMLRGFFHGQQPDELYETAAYRERLHSVGLPAGAHAVGQPLAELHLDELGVIVTALRHGNGGRPEKAPAEALLSAGDVLVLYGAPEALEQAERRLLQGSA